MKSATVKLLAVATAAVILAGVGYLAVFSGVVDQPTIHLRFLSSNLSGLDNVSVQLFAFYPTAAGTKISEVYNATGVSEASVRVSMLSTFARDWMNSYGDKLNPSLIGFASYVATEGNALVEYTQTFTVPYSPSNITQGKGETRVVVFNQPVERIIQTLPQASASKEGAGAAAASTTTTSTSVPNTKCSPNYGCRVGYKLNSVAYYPSGASLGPIPLIEVNASQAYLGGAAPYIAGNIHAYMETTSSTTLLLDLSQASTGGVSVNYQVDGPSLTLSSSSLKENALQGYGELGTDYPSTAQVDAYGQLALANYSAYYCSDSGCTDLIGYAVQAFTTALEVESSGGSSLPVLHATSSLSEPFSQSQKALAMAVPAGGENYSVSYELNSKINTLTASFKVAALFADTMTPPELGGLTVILPNLVVAYTTSQPGMTFTELYLEAASDSPYTLRVYYDRTPVAYKYDGNSLNLPTTVFYLAT